MIGGPDRLAKGLGKWTGHSTSKKESRIDTATVSEVDGVAGGRARWEEKR